MKSIEFDANLEFAYDDIVSGRIPHQTHGGINYSKIEVCCMCAHVMRQLHGL